MVHIYNEIFLSHKDKIMRFAAIWMDQETVILSEVSQTKTNNICGIGKKGGTKEHTYRTETVTDVKNKFIIMAGQR